MEKRLLSLVIVLVLCLGSAVPAIAADTYGPYNVCQLDDGFVIVLGPTFTDIEPEAYYYDSVKWAVDHKIASGITATTFSPDQTCTVAQILSFIWRANGFPEPTAANPFTDIKASDYYYKAAVWAAEKGLVAGNKLNPDTPCTRAMTMEYLWKAAGSPGESTYTPYTLTCKEWGNSDNIYFDAAMVKKDTVTLCGDYGDWDTEQVFHGEKTAKQVTMITLRPGSTMTINHTLYGNDVEFENICMGDHYQKNNDGIYHLLDVFTSDISDSFCYSGKRDTIGYAELITLDGTDYFITVSQDSSAFTDVPSNADYVQAVAWAVKSGVTSGMGNGQFSPDMICTRGQIMSFLYRAMGK